MSRLAHSPNLWGVPNNRIGCKILTDNSIPVNQSKERSQPFMPPEDDSGQRDRETRILDAAAQLFAHYGYDKTSVDEIASEAGISKGAVYLHFKSKAALMEALILREAERVTDQLIERVLSDPAGGTIFGMYTHSLAAIGANPLLRALYTRDKRVLGDMLRRHSGTLFGKGGMNFSTEFVQQMQAAGLIRSDIRAETIAYFLIVLRFSLLTVDETVGISDPPSFDEIAPVISEMLSRAFAPEGGDSEAGKRVFRQLVEYGRLMIAEMRRHGAD